MKQNISHQKGFSLIETIMVVVVLAIAIPSLLLRIWTGTRASANGEYTTIANHLAEDLMEEILEKRWDENTPSGGGTIPNGSKTAPASFGTAEGETRTTFDDIDDYHGLSENPPKDATNTSMTGYDDFTRTVSIIYVDTSNLNTAVVSTPRPDYKQIAVTVSWTVYDGGSVQLVTLRSNT